MNLDSRTTLKQVEDWLRKHGWWLFPIGIAFNLLALFCILGSVGRYDPNVLSVSLTILEVFIVVLAIGGFWMIRGAAISAARAAAGEEVKRLSDEGTFSNATKREMFVSNTGPANPPDLTNVVPEVAEDVSKQGIRDAARD